MTPTTPRESRNASSSSPITTIFFGVPSASGNSSDSNTGSQKRRSNSPIPVPAPLSVRNLLSSARSMGSPPEFCLLLLTEIGAGGTGRQRDSQGGLAEGVTHRSLWKMVGYASLTHPVRLHVHRNHTGRSPFTV